MTTAKPEHNPSIANPETLAPTTMRHPPRDVNQLTSAPVPRPSRHATHNNLSLPRSPLIGRDHEIAIIQQLLLQEHIGLLTLTGPVGIGKTRLALQVAANVLDHFVDGLYFVGLAGFASD